jgi:hypothetical protein
VSGGDSDELGAEDNGFSKNNCYTHVLEKVSASPIDLTNGLVITGLINLVTERRRAKFIFQVSIDPL